MSSNQSCNECWIDDVDDAIKISEWTLKTLLLKAENFDCMEKCSGISFVKIGS